MSLIRLLHQRGRDECRIRPCDATERGWDPKNLIAQKRKNECAELTVMAEDRTQKKKMYERKTE